MAETIDHFIPPEIGEASVLVHDLAPLPANACDAFLHAYVPDGGLVWDPFCRTAVVARSAARQGRRALLSDFNPLIAFTVHATLQPVLPRQLDRALSNLATAPTAQTTLEAHIASLYATTCPACGASCTARSFTWSQELGRPVSREFHCLACNMLTSAPVTDADIAILARTEERGRTYWALLERLRAIEGPLRPLGEHLLELYTPRSLYVLSTIESKLERSGADAAQDVLLLALLDAMTRCMKAPADDKRQTAAAHAFSERAAAARSGTFVEKNCWITFSEACSAQRARLEREVIAAPRAHAPSRPRDDSMERVRDITSLVSVRQASARRAAADLEDGSVDLILTSPPVIDWGDMLPLTYLWTGWLLGKEAANVFSTEYLLHPKRANDWAWFSGAMERSFRAMLTKLRPGGKMILCYPLAGLSYSTVLLLAAAGAGLCLENVAYQPSAVDAQRRPPALGAIPGYCYLRLGRPLAHRPLPPAAEVVAAARAEVLAAAVEQLGQRGEPAAFVWLYWAAMLRLSRTGLLAGLAAPLAEQPPPWDRLRQALAAIEQANGAELRFLPWAPAPDASTAAAGVADEETAPTLAKQRGWWWLSDTRNAADPVSDRAEWACYTVLSTSALPTAQAINRVVYALFPGLLTPDPGLIEMCVQSYATPASPIHWHLRADDALAQRTREQAEMLALLTNLGHRLGFGVWISQENLRQRDYGSGLGALLSMTERRVTVEDIVQDADERSQLVDLIWYRRFQATHVFEVEWTAMLGESVLRHATSVARLDRFVVAPAERLALIRAKLERSPLLQRSFAAGGWRVIRFDALRELGAAASPTLTDLEHIAGQQSLLEKEGVQLPLL